MPRPPSKPENLLREARRQKTSRRPVPKFILDPDGDMFDIYATLD